MSECHFLARMCVKDGRTIIGSNLAVIANMLKCDVQKVQLEGWRLLKQREYYSDCDIVSMIREICDSRNGRTYIAGFYSCGLDFICDFICTH